MKSGPVNFRVLLLVAGLSVSAPPSRGDVLESAPGGFTVRITLSVQATPADVYRALVRNVGDWWNPEHTFSGNAHNLSIDDKAMGCFCEKLADQGSVRHLEVVYAAPGQSLRMTGGLGPLQGIAASGSLTIALARPADAAAPNATAPNATTPNATTVQVTYAVAGYQPTGMESWAAPVDAMLTDQFIRFKTFVEKGSKGLKQPDHTRSALPNRQTRKPSR